MAEVKLTQQVKHPLTDLNLAQINKALVTYAQDQTTVAGLNAIKVTLEASIANYKDCPQCINLGHIDNGANICPLCNGMTKTQAQWAPVTGPVTGYQTV